MTRTVDFTKSIDLDGLRGGQCSRGRIWRLELWGRAHGNGRWETYGRRHRGEHEAAGAKRVAGTGPAAVPRKGPGHVAFAQPGPPLSATSDDGSKSLHPSQGTRLALTCIYGRAKEGSMWAPLWAQTVLREYVGRVVASNQGNASECWQDDRFTPGFYPKDDRIIRELSIWKMLCTN